jgi:hypothetical protein
MNDLYNETITRNGREYHYDPDRDIYYAYTEETAISKSAWIWTVLILSAVAYYVEYLR